MQQDNVKWLQFTMRGNTMIAGIQLRSMDSRYVYKYLIANGTLQMPGTTDSSDSFEDALMHFCPSINRKSIVQVEKPQDFYKLKSEFNESLPVDFKCRAIDLVK
jgi:hypothetical protein